MAVREALLDDTAAICALLRQGVGTWQRLDSRGQVETVSYEALSVYERWTHGGAWMSVETGAIHLSRLLRGVGLALVAEQEGEIRGYAEAYPSSEPAPFGEHLHIALIAHAPDYFTSADALINGVMDVARTGGVPLLTVSLAGASDERHEFYTGYGFQRIETVHRYTVPTRAGQVFYRVNDLTSANPSLIQGWHMPIGRTESAAQHWEASMPRHWDVIPQIARQRVYRLSLNVSGQEACLHAAQHPYDPRTLSVACWSQRPLTPQVLSALRDWSHSQGYRSLSLVTTEATARLFANEAERDPYRREIYALRLESDA